MLLSWELGVWAAAHLQQFIIQFLPVSLQVPVSWDSPSELLPPYFFMSVAPLSWRFLIFEFLFILLRPSLLYITVLHTSSQAELFILRGSEVVCAKPHVSREVNRQLPRDVFLKMREGIRVSSCLYLCAPLWHTVDAFILWPWSSWSGFQIVFAFHGSILSEMGEHIIELLKVEESSHHSTHELSVPTPTPVVIKFKEVLSHLDGCTSKNKRAYT